MDWSCILEGVTLAVGIIWLAIVLRASIPPRAKNQNDDWPNP